MNERSKIELSQPDAALKELEPLVGEWHMLGTHPAFSFTASDTLLLENVDGIARILATPHRRNER